MEISKIKKIGKTKNFKTGKTKVKTVNLKLPR